MKSIDRLVAEHDVIERGLSLLESAVARIEAGHPIPDGFGRWAPMFFREFADKCHHAKEEDLFFPLLKERGIPEEGGPIGVMLHEHVMGRDCAGRMRAAAEREEFDAVSFAAAAKEFVPLLRQHIFKENNVLFKMAERCMNDEDDDGMDSRFSEVESEKGISGLREQYAAEIASWEESLG